MLGYLPLWTLAVQFPEAPSFVQYRGIHRTGRLLTRIHIATVKRVRGARNLSIWCRLCTSFPGAKYCSMGHMHKSAATLRIVGDDLIPGEVSSLLGCAPTMAQKKGEVLVGKKTGIERVARTGMWRLHSVDQEPENLDGQIEEILTKVTGDIETWQALAGRYRVDLFCGLFMGTGNEGVAISPGALFALGQRGIELALDVYGPE